MSLKKVRLIVSTNTNVRFLTAVPASFTIERALPLLFEKYRTVIAENMGPDHALLRGQSILHLTRKGCLVAREEVVHEIFGEGEEVHVNIGHEDQKIDGDRPKVNQLSKRQKLDIKKHEKGATSSQVERSQKKPEVQKIEKRQIRQHAQKKHIQGQQSLNGANSDKLASKFLSKFRSSQKPIKPSQEESRVKKSEKEDKGNFSLKKIKVIDDSE